MADRMDAIAAFRATVFADPMLRAGADQMQAGIRNMFGENGAGALLFAAVVIESLAANEEAGSELFMGLIGAAMLLRAASGE